MVTLAAGSLVKVPDIPPHDIWYTLSAIFFIIGIIGGLGEWVFHWWGEPWDVGTPISLFLGVLTLAWGGSAKDIRSMHGDLRSGFTEVAAASANSPPCCGRSARASAKASTRSTRLKSSRPGSSASWWPPFAARRDHRWARSHRLR